MEEFVGKLVAARDAIGASDFFLIARTGAQHGRLAGVPGLDCGRLGCLDMQQGWLEAAERLARAAGLPGRAGLVGGSPRQKVTPGVGGRGLLPRPPPPWAVSTS